jgi:hypothetical protein
MKVVHGQADLLAVVPATNAIGRLPDFLHCRQQERNEHSDNGNYDQQLDESETGSEPPQPSEHSHRSLLTTRKKKMKQQTLPGTDYTDKQTAEEALSGFFHAFYFVPWIAISSS